MELKLKRLLNMAVYLYCIVTVATLPWVPIHMFNNTLIHQYTCVTSVLIRHAYISQTYYITGVTNHVCITVIVTDRMASYFCFQLCFFLLKQVEISVVKKMQDQIQVNKMKKCHITKWAHFRKAFKKGGKLWETLF